MCSCEEKRENNRHKSPNSSLLMRGERDKWEGKDELWVPQR